MSTAPRFAIVTENAPGIGWHGFVPAVARRLTWTSVALAALAVWLLAVLRTFSSTFQVPAPGTVPREMLWSSFVILGCEAIFLLLAVLAADEAVERGAPRRRSYVIAVVCGAALAALAQYGIRLPLGWRTMLSGEEFLVQITQPLTVFFGDFLINGALATFVYVNLRTARHAGARRRAAELARLEASRRTLESRLQAMQARVEPQFLFNTLAQVKQHYDSDAALAGKMLDDLIAYLRAALPHLRESSSTLGKEAALARAYLDIVRVRLGERLAFDIEIPEGLADARLPPMMLLPLIDHALVYGLEPSQAGGTIRIETGIGDGMLRLAITDSGAGFVPGGDGDDLRNIGERLHALYGDDASLRLERIKDRGTQAILEIPYEPADRSDR